MNVVMIIFHPSSLFHKGPPYYGQLLQLPNHRIQQQPQYAECHANPLHAATLSVVHDRPLDAENWQACEQCSSKIRPGIIRSEL